MKKTIAILSAFLLLSLTASANLYTVTQDDTAVRYAAGEEYDNFYVLNKTEQAYGQDAGNGWVEIDCYGFKGYVRADQVEEQRTFLGRFYVTGYDTCYDCCRKTDGITASGARATVGRTVAMSGVPFGTRIYIEGIGERVVEDRGVSSGMVDVLCNNHAECYALTGYYAVYIIGCQGHICP